MRIAVASGKGGTGKTTLATSLAISLAADQNCRAPLVFLDCDVEAPNSHLYLKPVFQENKPVEIPIPRIDDKCCTYCGKCAEVCQYHAIVVLGKKTLVFPQLCHGCGSCAALCPESAISEKGNPVGVLERGQADRGIEFGRGVLDVGEPMAVPVINQLKRWMITNQNQLVILDAPPGTSCPVVASIQGADYVILVTEPTPFGLHDLRLAVELSEELDVSCGVVINRDQPGYKPLEVYCQDKDLPVLLRIPFDRRIAEGIARGQTLVEIYPDYETRLQQLYRQIEAESGRLFVPSSIYEVK